jgi:hypothetical protein
MTITMTKTTETNLAVSWRMLDQMEDDARPGDQVVFTTPGRNTAHDILAILNTDGLQSKGPSTEVSAVGFDQVRDLRRVNDRFGDRHTPLLLLDR